MRIKMYRKANGGDINVEFNDYIDFCKSKNLSEATIKYYRVVLRKFIEFTGKNFQIKSINNELIIKYKLWLIENYSNNTSINSFIRGIRTFIYYLIDNNDIEKFQIKLIRAEKKLKETYTSKEIEALLIKPNLRTCIFSEYRNWVVINYLLSTGNRLSTVINLKIANLDFENEIIYMKKNKNNKQQIIPMSLSLKRILMEYLRFRNGEKNEHLFCNRYGKILHPNSLIQAIRKYNRRRGVSKTSIHLFRHTFAKHYLLAGGNMFKLQKILGHSSLDMVKEYINLFNDEIKIDFNELNPLESYYKNNTTIKMRNKK